MDNIEFPLFMEAQYIEGLVGPGEALYIPVSFLRRCKVMLIVERVVAFCEE